MTHSLILPVSRTSRRLERLWWRIRWRRTYASPGRRSEVVEHFEVFEERGLDVDGQSHHFTATFGGRDLGLLRWKRWYVEELRDSLAALDLHEENALAAFGQRERQRGGNRGLTGSAFT